MSWQIPKTNWSSADGVTSADMDRIEANIQYAAVVQMAGGSATVLTLDSSASAADGLLTTFIAASNNSGSPTTINGKPLYKPYSTNTPTLIANKPYTVWYNASGNCFFIKASAEGTAVAANVLAGTTFSNDNDTGLKGTMPNNGVINITPSGAAHTIPAGYTTGGSVSAVSVPVANVLSGTTIAGQTGTMPNNGAVTMTPSGSDQAIAAGYHNGSGKVSAVTVPVANVLTGTTIAGQAGTMPERGAVTITPSTSDQAILAGHHNGSGKVIGDSNLQSLNILKDKPIFGVVGTVEEKQDFFDCLYNSVIYGTDNLIPAGYIEGEGLWLAKSNYNTTAQVSLYNSTGTVLKKITCSTASCAIHVTEQHILWVDQGNGNVIVTDKNGITLFSFSCPTIKGVTYLLACINETSKLIFVANFGGNCLIYNFSGTLLYNVSIIPFNTYSISCTGLLPFKNGVIIVNTTSGQCELDLVTNDGNFKRVPFYSQTYRQMLNIMANSFKTY